MFGLGIVPEALDVDIALVSLTGEIVYANPRARANWAIPPERARGCAAFQALWEEIGSTIVRRCSLMAASTTWKPFALHRRVDGRRIGLKGRRVRSQIDGAPALVLIVSDRVRRGAFRSHAARLQRRELDRLSQARAETQRALTCETQSRVENIHRTRNHFALLLSMSRMARRGPPASPHRVLAQCERRISAVAALNDILSRSQDMQHVRMDALLASLCAGLQHSVNGRAVSVVAECGPIALNASDATPLSLVTNEAITNALQHTFPDCCDGEIRVTLQPFDDERLALSICDNVTAPHAPVGPEPDAEPFGARSRMIAGLASQLGATVTTAAATHATGRSMQLVFQPHRPCVSQHPAQLPPPHPPPHDA